MIVDPYARVNRMFAVQDVTRELEAQDKRWGRQEHEDGTGSDFWQRAADDAKLECEAARARGEMTYLHVLNEEVCEAFAESDQEKLRAELVQVAAVAVQWIESIDRRPV